MPDDQGQSMAGPPQGEAELRSALERSEARLQALLAQQEAFAYGISHDLRAPLRVIDAYSAMLERQSGDRLDQAGRDQLARIREAAGRMGALFESLLEYSRAERSEMSPAPVDIGLLAELALSELQEAEPTRELRAPISSGLVAMGDERLLQLMVAQLVRNAWRFSGDTVVLEVVGVREGDMLRVSVRDQGSGFDMRYVDRIFEPFQRLHLPEQGAGQGLGLAIAARVIQRHGGSLRAESTPGAGSTFHFELPAADGEGPATP
jgi:signal transduction histidine kinase